MKLNISLILCLVNITLGACLLLVSDELIDVPIAFSGLCFFAAGTAWVYYWEAYHVEKYRL